MHTRTRGTEKFRLEEGGTRNTKRRRNSKRSGVVPLPRWGAVRRKSVPAGRSPSRGRSKRDHVAIRSHPTVLSPRTLLLLSLSLSLSAVAAGPVMKKYEMRKAVGNEQTTRSTTELLNDLPPPVKCRDFHFSFRLFSRKDKKGKKKDTSKTFRWLGTTRR